MISKNDIINAARQFVRHQRGKKVRRIIHPKREWSIGLVLFTLLVIVGSGAGWWQYTTSQARNIPVFVSVETKTARYDEQTANELIATYNERRETYRQLQSELIAAPATTPTLVATSTVVSATSSPLSTTATTSLLEAATEEEG